MTAYNCNDNRFREILRMLFFTEDSYFKRLYNQSPVVNDINRIFDIDTVYHRDGETNADTLTRLRQKISTFRLSTISSSG